MKKLVSEFVQKGYTNAQVAFILNFKNYKEVSKFKIENNINRVFSDLHCINCEKVLTNNQVKFCSRSCSVKINNKKRSKLLEKYCKNCSKNMKGLDNKTFCSKKCEFNFKTKEQDLKIENGHEKCGNRSVKRYLVKKFGEKCMECGWSEINIYTGKIPIELEHIDGNNENNSLKNLRLLCPNHHSLTSTYRALNVGKGKRSRTVKYLRDISFK